MYSLDKKYIAGAILLILLYLLFRRKAPLRENVTSKILDPVTGFPIGYGGIARDSLTIGEALLPAGIRNDVSDTSFQYAAVNGEISCPIGTQMVIDPDTNKVYCTNASIGV